MLEIFTTSPELGRVHESAAADVDPVVAEAVEEDDVARPSARLVSPASHRYWAETTRGSEMPTREKTYMTKPEQSKPVRGDSPPQR